MKLKETLNLPQTDFPMKAALPKREPERLAQWEKDDLYRRIRERRRGRPTWILHDGPPYANGHVHLGTAINKSLKDFVVRSRSQMGYDTPYVPGWDCHGMPIEHQVVKLAREAGETLDVAEVRKRCRAFADKFVDVQRGEFKRLGVMGEWDDPYLTTDPAYEAAIVGAFGQLFEKGYIYKGLRSIHWCPTCRTALANAEVEHDPEHVSTAVHVRFELVPDDRSRTLGVPDGAAMLAWTTTPWTLPANVANAVHPDFEYALVGGDARHAVVAKALLPRVKEEVGWADAPVLATWTGRQLEGLTYRHPFLPRTSPVVLADYVTLDAGTGVVHTAPGHGEEDFETGVRLKLPILVPVDKGGVYTAEAGPYAGQHVYKANAKIVADLKASGALVHESRVKHSYPTCWRCHDPVMFLATDQWFLRADHEDLRERCLREVEKADWIPPWGEDRMRDSVKTRPDWCLSRQRAWGVPVPAFSCKSCGSAVLDTHVISAVEKLVREHGSAVWFERSAAEIVPPGTKCGACGSGELEKDPNILDVWFDASCSHLAVLASGRWKDLRWPAELYLEAVDQHRGWFQVSLLNAVALRGSAPYHAVYTHGLILDEAGRKMSKSLGNVVSPKDIIESHGADVLRFYFASVDATADSRFSKVLLEPVAEGYRKVRNTLRFLLGNLAGYDPDAHAVPEESMEELDRWALARLRQVSAETRKAYEQMAFHKVHRALLQYLTTDVSALYAHVLKDRLYTEARDGQLRRSAQTALFEIARETTQLLAPIACFTVEEVWEALPAWKGKTPSVHEATWPDLPATDAARLNRWAQLLDVRQEVLKSLELARASGLIGDPLEASVKVAVPAALGPADDALTALLREIFMVSAVSLEPRGPAPAGARAFERDAECWTAVERAPGEKCPRCWNYRTDGGRLPGHPQVCGRCADVVLAMNVELEPA